MTIVSQIGEAEAGGFVATRGRDNTRAFRAAVRHSRFVRFVRLAIPVLVIGSAGLLAAYSYLDPMRALAKLPIGADGLVISGTKIVMQQPRMAGFTKDERPYTIVARTAAKDLKNPDVMEMQDVHATVVVPDQSNMVITSRDGLYDSKADTVRLRNDVVVTTVQYRLEMQDALIHIREGQVVSDQPIQVNMLQGTINANRMEIRKSGETIRFERGVVMVIDREAGPADAMGAVR